MPQMAIIQPTSPKGQPQTKKAVATGDEEQNAFSPHLDKAVSKKKQPHADDRRATPPVKKNTDVPAPLNSLVKQTAEPEQSLDILGMADPTGLITLPNENGVQLAQLPQQIKPGAHQIQNIVESGAGKIIVSETLSVAVGSTSIEALAANGDKSPAVKPQNVLLDQLQRIIDQSDEAGTVFITKARNGTPGNSINSMRSNMHGVLVPVPPENSAQVVAGKTGTRSPQQVTDGSHDSRQHSFNPKIAVAESGDARQNFQDQQQGDELRQQTIRSGPQNGPSSGLSSAPEQTSTFSQIVTPPQQPTSQVADTPDRPILLPSGIIVQEDDIIQQLSHKMQISGKNMDTRIHLRLHPAELGSLKIDLTVKEGSIRANVIAQSQHTTELLEKNMAKLKTVLENQGYTVDEILITAESESVSDFDLFERQMFSHNDYTPKSQKAGKEADAVFSLTDTLFAAPELNTGVNVKI